MSARHALSTSLNFYWQCLCEDLQIKKPSLEVGKAKKKSYARGSTKIVLAESMMNIFVLVHELSHIYGNATKTAEGHCQNFLAIEFAILAKLGYQDLANLFNLAKEHKIAVNENYAKNVFHLMRQGDD